MAINVEKFKKRILTEKARLQADHARLNNYGGETAAESVGELTDFDSNHPGDAGTQLFEREKDEALTENVDSLLQQIDVALTKIDQGTYGKCDRCGKPIGDARLDALPYVSLCIDCQSRAEGA